MERCANIGFSCTDIDSILFIELARIYLPCGN